MVRGTTPTLTFTIPFDPATLTDGWVTFKCGSTNALDKRKSTWTVNSSAKTITLKLTQEDTLRLKKGAVKIQIRGKTAAGNAVASKEIETTVEDILRDGVI